MNATRDGSRGLVQINDSKVATIAKDAFTDVSAEKTIIAIDGREIDPRMLAQLSRFTLHSDPTPLEEFTLDSATWLRQYIIPKKAKRTVRKQLLAFGIRRSNLFPDLASLAAELKSSFWADT